MEIDNNFKNVFLGTLAGTSAAILLFGGGYAIYNKINEKNDLVNDLKSQIERTKRDVEIDKIICDKLKKEAINISSYIAENTMNLNQLKTFDTKTWNDKLVVINEAWKNAEVTLKLNQSRLEALTSQLIKK